MATRARKAKLKSWSYSAGERGENRVRVFERPGYGIWIDYCDEARKRHGESLGTANRDEAKAKADDTAAKFRREAKRQPQERKDITLAELIDIYDREVTSRKAGARQRYERRTFPLFKKQFGAQRLVKILSRRDWDASIAARQTGQLRPTGAKLKRPVRNQIIRHDLTLLGMILSWACEAGDGNGGFLIERNPLKIKRRNGDSGVLLPKELSAKRPILSAKQFDAVRAAAVAESSCAEVFVVLAWRTGHRANSIRHLRWSDVDLEGKRLHWCAERDKVGRVHVTPMHPDVAAVLQREWQIAEVLGGTRDSWVFPAPKKASSPIGRDTVNKWWQRFARAAELPKGQGYGWHSCRRGFANRLHRAGAALKDLQGLGGWKTSATLVDVYLQADEEGQRRALSLDDSA